MDAQGKDGGKTYNVVIVGSPNVNEGYKLVNNRLYPNIASDYEHTFAVLKSLPCDIFLGAHGDYYKLSEKYPRLKTGGANPFIDPEGYREYVADREAAFRTELKKQSTGSAALGLLGPFRGRNAFARLALRTASEIELSTGLDQRCLCGALEERVSLAAELPRQRTCQFLARLVHGLLDGFHQSLILRIALLVTRKAAEVGAGDENTSTPGVEAISSAIFTPAGDSIIATIMTLSFAICR